MPRATNFLNQVGAGIYPVVYLLGAVVIIVAPAIIGIFWGAPMIARELETGTFRLAWTQSITRTRWLAVKLALTGLAAMAVTEGLSLIYDWWSAPIGQAASLAASRSFPLGLGPFSALIFITHGITPLGYAAFVFALGTAAGVLIRRVVPAMAVTLAIFAVAQVAMPLWVRPHLIPPDRTIAAISAVNADFSVGSRFAVRAAAVPGQPGAWILSSGAANAAGQPAIVPPAACSLSHGLDQFPGCLASHGIRVAISYQPVSRYWPFQWIETGIFLALALALAGFCFWRLGRRRT